MMNYGRIIQKERIKVYEVADNVFAAISPYRGLSWVNAGFINKGEGLVFDTFFDLFHAEEMRQVYEDVSGYKLPKYVVNSHYNADHTWGNKIFKDSTIIMHKEAIRERLSEDPAIFDRMMKAGKTPEGNAGERYIANEFDGFDLTGVEWIEPDILIQDDTTIMLDDMEVQILNIAPAHSDSDLLLWLPKEKVVFTGDIVFNGAVGYSEEGIRKWNKALDFLIDLKPDVVVPGHGAICDIEFVKEQKAYFDMVLSEFEKHYDDDISVIELSKKIDVSDFLHWLQPERIFMNINSLVIGRRNLSPIPDWEYNAKAFTEMREFHKQKYGDKIKPWDPMSTWVE